jgi:hypothetical protein
MQEVNQSKLKTGVREGEESFVISEQFYKPDTALKHKVLIEINKQIMTANRYRK